MTASVTMSANGFGRATPRWHVAQFTATLGWGRSGIRLSVLSLTSLVPALGTPYIRICNRISRISMGDHA